MAEHRGSVLHVPQNEEMGKGRQTKARGKWTRLHARDNRLIEAFRRIFIRGTRRNERGRGGRVSSVWETNGHWANFVYCVRGLSVVVSIHEWVFSFSIAGRGPFPRQNNNLLNDIVFTRTSWATRGVSGRRITMCITKKSLLWLTHYSTRLFSF